MEEIIMGIEMYNQMKYNTILKYPFEISEYFLCEQRTNFYIAMLDNLDTYTCHLIEKNISNNITYK